MTNDEIVARALYARRFPDAPVAEHFGWYDNGKHDTESCVHYSNVGTAYKDAGASLTALSSAGRLVEKGDVTMAGVHPFLQVDVQAHRDAAYKGGWDDGYAEGYGKAEATASAPHPAPDATDVGCCEGCGSTETIGQIRARNPQALSCCPERKMLSAKQWSDRATDWKAQCEAAEAEFATVFERVNREIPDEFALDPPDGGDVKIWEAVGRMREALTAAQAENEKLRAALRRIADRGTVAGTHEQDQAERLQRIAIAALSPPPLSPEKP